MFLFGVDFETTGLDHKQDRVIETGICVWDTVSREPALIESFYSLGPEWPLPTDEARAITGISDEWVKAFHFPDRAVLERIQEIAKKCDFMVAHNAEFEMNFINTWVKLQEIPNWFGSLLVKKWIDTKIHLPYPPNIGVRDLVSLCAYHGFFNPHPHRAFFDAWAMMKVFDHYLDDSLDEIIKNSQAPRVKIWSKGITFQTKDLPKSLGYYWDTPSKRWWTVVKESETDEAISKAKQKGFEVEVENVPVYTTIAELEKLGGEKGI
jgi:DNA polymerase III alpha subunit (gram-positive type)